MSDANQLNILNTKTFTVTKKNRKYFVIIFENGFRSKLLIDELSEDFKINKEYSIALIDDSVHSKYGTDSKYRVDGKVSVEAQQKAGVITLKSDYNTRLVKECRRIGGRWDREAGVWVFSDLIADMVDALEKKYNSTKVAVEITIVQHGIFAEKQLPVSLAGVPIAGGAKSRDGGCNIYEGVSFVSGDADSGGSIKNYGTSVKGGSVIRMWIPVSLYSEIESSEYVGKIDRL